MSQASPTKAKKEIKKEEDDLTDSSESSPSSSDSEEMMPLIKPKTPVPAAKKTVASSSSKKSAETSDDSSSSPTSTSSDSDDTDDEEEEAEASADSEKPRPRKKQAANASSRPTRAAAAGGKGKRSGGKRKEGLSVVFPCSDYDVKQDVAPLQPSHGANKWWNRNDDEDSKWITLEHNGVLFPDPYKPHGVKMLYDGKPVTLTAEEEEFATYYAQMLETDHVLKKPAFRKNFFKDWKKILGDKHVIKELEKCDFTPIFKHETEAREAKKEARKDKTWKDANKKKIKEEQDVFGYALVDGFKEKIANFKVEVPGLFRGRGDHPKTGMIKRRVVPEDVIINIGEHTPIPKPPAGHQWKGIVHNNQVTWLANWPDYVNGEGKYVWLSAASRFKGTADIEKYSKAQRLKDKIGDIRKDYNKQMLSDSLEIRQRATAIYLIDKLALRVGNEKDTSEEADTVGCCSLRVEHLTFTPPSNVFFKFLGKDSMPYENDVKLDQQAYDNIKKFCAGKSPDQDVFDKLSTQSLNEHLKTLMEGLTAKVFRTYNASITLQMELRDPAKDQEISVDDTEGAKILFYNRANREVAILCNHQRTLPKQFDSQMLVMKEQETKIVEERDFLLAHMDEISGNKSKKSAPKKRKLESGEDAKEYSFPSEMSKCESKLASLNERLGKIQNKITLKDDTKTVALGTSKINYMDPRITVAWCKHKEVPIEKIFNASLLIKFPWAMEVASTWTF